MLKEVLHLIYRNGFRELSLSFNLIGDEGAKELAVAIRRTTSLEILRVAGCGIGELGGEILQDALAANSTIIIIDARHNPMSIEQESLVNAEVEANELIYEIRKDPMKIDCNILSQFVSCQRFIPDYANYLFIFMIS